MNNIKMDNSINMKWYQLMTINWPHSTNNVNWPHSMNNDNWPHSVINNLPHSINNNLPHSINNNLPHSVNNNLPHSITKNLPHSINNNWPYSNNNLNWLSLIIVITTHAYGNFHQLLNTQRFRSERNTKNSFLQLLPPMDSVKTKPKICVHGSHLRKTKEFSTESSKDFSRSCTGMCWHMLKKKNKKIQFGVFVSDIQNQQK